MALYGKKPVAKPGLVTGADWEPVNDTSVPRNRGIFMSVNGRDGAGKSSLAMTLAEMGPLAYVDIDRSSDRALKPATKKQREGIKVLPVSYAVALDEDENKKICEAVWENLAAKVRAAANDWAKGVVIDTGDELWELKRFASFGKQSGSGRRMDRVYGPVNAQFRQLLRDVYRNSKRHLILTHKMKEEYQDKKNSQGEDVSVKTGKWVSAGFKEIPYMADVIVEAFQNEDNEFAVKIVNCKLGPIGPSMRGQELTGEDATFAGIVALATGTDRDEWR